MAIGGLLRAAMMAQDWGSVARQSRELSRGKQLLPVVNEFPMRGAHLRATKSRLSPTPWESSVDARVAEKASIDRVGAVNDELRAKLLRRYSQGKPVPSWFEPINPDPLNRYNIARARTGFGGQGGERIPVRSPMEARRSAQRVAAGVGATRVPYDRIREIQKSCGVSGNPKVCRIVSDRIERELGYPMQLGFWKARQHAWNVMDDGTIIDATAGQFGLPSIHVIPGAMGRILGYRGMTPGQVKYWEEADLYGWKNLSDEDWLGSSLGREQFDLPEYIEIGLDYDEGPWEYAKRRGQELSNFFMMPYGQRSRPRTS